MNQPAQSIISRSLAKEQFCKYFVHNTNNKKHQSDKSYIYFLIFSTVQSAITQVNCELCQAQDIANCRVEITAFSEGSNISETRTHTHAQLQYIEPQSSKQKNNF